MKLPKSILLIITGSIASYKSLELIRLLRAQGISVTAILTKGGSKFITPLAISSLTGTKTYDDLFSLTDEVEMGHIELSRVADLVLVAPASADILAKMAHGIADDLATTALLATNKPIAIAPAMNHKMWSHCATQRNVTQLVADGVKLIEPTAGDMACGEFGVGRMAEPSAIIEALKLNTTSALEGKHAIVTSGPTMEALDPVRYLGNHSSGKQGHAIAEALLAAGARVTLISGPTSLTAPAGATLVNVSTADEMLAAAEKALPADILVSAAAVADWKPAKPATNKIKKDKNQCRLTLELVPTTDVLARISSHTKRPRLVIGFAAETENLLSNARTKRNQKGCDWILANDVKGGAVFGSEANRVTLLTDNKELQLNGTDKKTIARALVDEVITHFSSSPKRLVKGKIA